MTPDQMQRLRELWAAGRSEGQIEAELGLSGPLVTWAMKRLGVLARARIGTGGSAMDALKLMRAWFPTWTDEQRHDVLWNCTAYPCGGLEIVTEQLRKLRAKAIRGATPDELIAEAEREIEAAMEERTR